MHYVYHLRASLLCIIAAFLSCTPKGETFYEAGAQQPAPKPARNSPPLQEKTTYFIYENGAFIPGQPDKEPMPIGGKEAYNRAMFSQLNYPAAAREAGIRGTVLVTVIVNEAGRMESAVVSKGIGGGCDEEALKAVQRGGQAGFEPALQGGVPVKVKYDVPVKFSVL